MKFKHKKTLIYPKDSQNFKDDLGRLITESFRDIYDDIQNLEKQEDGTSLPSATSYYRGKIYLLTNTGSTTDIAYICIDTGSAGYGWKTMSLT